MSKRRARKRAAHPLAKPAQPAQPPAFNPRLSAQTRKILLKHYRTKYGVRSRGGR